MKLGDLQTFVDIVEAGGLTAAANRRGVTQPALSRLLRDLETRLRAQLLRRTGRGIELTPAGREFLGFATDTLARYSETRKKIGQASEALPDKLRLSVPLRVGRLLIPDLYRDFNERLPDTTVHIFEEPSDRAVDMLASGDLNAALTYRPEASSSDPTFVPLFIEDLFAVGNETLVGDPQQPIPMRTLSQLPLLLPGTGRYRDLIHAAFRSAGHALRTARELETAEALLAFAAEGEGVAILPRSNIFAEVERREIAARLITGPAISRQIGVQLGPTMSKATATPVLAVIRKSMQRSRAAGAWRKPDVRSPRRVQR